MLTCCKSSFCTDELVGQILGTKAVGKKRAQGGFIHTVFTVDDIVRDGENRHVHYTICAGEGMSKKKTATVKKIEGVWKVEEITDRP